MTRFILGLAVIHAMAIGGHAAATVFIHIGVPYAAWLGVGAGAVLIFAAFTVLYRRYDESYTTESE